VFCSLKLKQGFCLSQLSDMSSVPFLCINFEWIQSRKHQQTIHMFDLVHHMIWSKQYIYQFLMEVLFFLQVLRNAEACKVCSGNICIPVAHPPHHFQWKGAIFFERTQRYGFSFHSPHWFAAVSRFSICIMLLLLHYVLSIDGNSSVTPNPY
jgi:hypothetical protein